MARSLADGCGKLGMKFVMATPKGYQFDDDVSRTAASAKCPSSTWRSPTDPAEAVRDAAAVYTDVWTSMGQEAEAEQRRRRLRRLPGQRQADGRSAPTDACFMHCLPAHRGEEVTDDVIDGPQSIVVQQAANRLHVQKGILAWLLGAQG